MNSPITSTMSTLYSNIQILIKIEKRNKRINNSKLKKKRIDIKENYLLFTPFFFSFFLREKKKETTCEDLQSRLFYLLSFKFVLN